MWFLYIGVLFWGPSMRDPVVLGPYQVPLIFGNSHVGPYEGCIMLYLGVVWTSR